MKRWITADWNGMDGKPVVAGTRITVDLVLEKLAAGETIDQIFDAYPRLTREAILAAIDFARECASIYDANDVLPGQIDWNKARPNPFAGKVRHRVVMPLDPDVAEVFKTPEAVNKALRAIIEAMPDRTEEPAEAA